MKTVVHSNLALLFVIFCILSTVISCNKQQQVESKQGFSDQALAYYKTGIACQSQNEDSSFYYYEKALKYSSSHDTDTLKPFILFRIAALHFKAFNYKEALELFDSAMVEAKHFKNFVVVTNCLNELSNLELDLNNIEQSRLYLEQALQTAEQYQLNLQIGVTLGNLANLETNSDSAIKIMKRAISTLKNIKGAEMEYCTILANMANNTSESGKAIKLYNEAIAIAEKGRFSEILIGAYNNLACTYLKNNKMEDAEICLRDHAIPIAFKTANTDWLSTVYESYA